MEITINIQAPELAHAIETLAIAIGCTVDKIGVGQAIEEAVQQKPTAPKETKTKETKKAEEAKAAAPTPDPEPDPKVEDAAVAEDRPILTIEQVREAFMAKNTKSNTAKLKAILKKFNVAKVTDLPEEHFADVLKELEAI
ncbi:MAG: hypothetical protein ABFC28_01445 [Rikenellaceae bacterium]